MTGSKFGPGGAYVLDISQDPAESTDYPEIYVKNWKAADKGIVYKKCEDAMQPDLNGLYDRCNLAKAKTGLNCQYESNGCFSPTCTGNCQAPEYAPSMCEDIGDEVLCNEASTRYGITGYAYDYRLDKCRPGIVSCRDRDANTCTSYGPDADGNTCALNYWDFYRDFCSVDGAGSTNEPEPDSGYTAAVSDMAFPLNTRCCKLGKYLTNETSFVPENATSI